MTSHIANCALFHLLASPVLICTLALLVQAADPLKLYLSEKVPAQCDTIELSWTGGTPNYTIQISSSTSPVLTAPVLTAFGLTNTSIAWTANRCGGDHITIAASDSGGFKVTVSFTLKPSTNTSCLTYTQQNSPQCLLESVSLHAPSATSTPTVPVASQDDSSSTHVPIIIAMVVVGIIAMVLGLTCRIYRLRRRRGLYSRFATSDWNGRQNTLLERPPPYAQPEDSQVAPPVYFPDRQPSDPVHGSNQRVPAAESVQMAELPRTAVVPDVLPTSIVPRHEDDRPATHAAAGTDNTRLTGDSHQTLSHEEGRAASRMDDDEAPPPAYSEL
ncbi:hypothetical protein C8T65DRAFT_28281 [Cerioporus squamosus]|nr:hypothetical protein C8T65DRAFT_28281 [Cerioporus squamosus]